MQKRTIRTAVVSTDATPVKSMLTTDERIRLLFIQPPKVLARIDAILQGQDSVSGMVDADVRLVSFVEAARRLNVSRPTVYRAVKAGRLEVVRLNGDRRNGRIRLQSVIDFANGKEG